MKNSSIPATCFQLLQELSAKDKAEGIQKKFQDDGVRANRYTYEFDSLSFDFSKSHIGEELVSTYEKFSKAIDFETKRLGLFSGEAINASENRSVLHTLLRAPDNHGVEMSDAKLGDQANAALQDYQQSYTKLSKKIASRSEPLTDIIHVGIGGSSLGTQLLFEALKELDSNIQIHFIANIDAHQLAEVLENCDVKSTMVFGVSKTFTTAETLQNISSIGEWFEANGRDDFLNEVVAITAIPENAKKYGVPEENTVVFPEWVGGRYSLWSSVSLSASLVLGQEKIDQLLAGAKAMDAHFLNTPVTDNLSFIAAALDHYAVNFLGANSRAVFAYDHRLRSLVSYLQQLETESNGKDRQVDGSPVDQLTSPVVWGGVGTDVQHSVFQMLHQGTGVTPAEFILTINPDHDLDEHHAELLANGLAQTAALLEGQTLEQVQERHASEDLSELTQKTKIFSGNRPSITILLEQLDAYSLGALLAFYEHRTFCYGVLCNINSFDQMGVELGKRLAKTLRPLLKVDEGNRVEVEQTISSLDPSTQSLLNRVHSKTKSRR